MLYTVVNITDADPEVCIRLFKSRNSIIQVIFDQEDNPYLDDECLTANERLTYFRKAIDWIVGRVKVSESASV